MTVVLVAGGTDTARISGISAAGANPDVMVHTPSADLEIVTYGKPVYSPVVPVSPTGCPTPAVHTRAVREAVGFDLLTIDAGLPRRTAAPTVEMVSEPGADIRESEAVPAAEMIFDDAREFTNQIGDSIDGELRIGETIPGGTTTALGVLTALGERRSVSSSLPENPLELKQEVVEGGLRSSGLDPGDAAGEPTEAVRYLGDPVLATVSGMVAGAAEAGIDITLAGGTQMAAAAALARHAGVDAPIELATTSFLAADETASIRGLTADLGLDLTVTDPQFDQRNHPSMNAYTAGEAKEGVGMGGSLAIIEGSSVGFPAVHDRIEAVYEALLAAKKPSKP